MAKLPAYYEARHPRHRGIYLIEEAFSENIESAMRYEAEAGDLFLCSYPKSGTTWLQNIVWRMIHKGEPFTGKLHKYIPFLEYDGMKDRNNKTTRRVRGYNVIKTHFPYQWVPKHPEAKYIFIIREPKDVCVSFYYHIKGFPIYKWDGTFNDIVEGFLAGKLDSMDYFGMLNDWNEAKDNPSVLFLLYENLLTSTKETILKIAAFLGPKYLAELSENNFKYPDEILEETSLVRMKKEDARWFYGGPECRTIPFVRKGIVGDWKNHMTPAQANAIDKRLKESANGNGADDLWSAWKGK